MENSYKEKIKNAVAACGNPEENLITILQIIQNEEGYISKDAVKALSEIGGIPESRIMGVASFYAGFRLKPVGKYRITVCKGTACHVNGSEHIGETVGRILGVPSGELSKDGLFSWEEAACLGCCSISPAMMINSTAYGELTPEKAEHIINEIRKKEGVL